MTQYGHKLVGSVVYRCSFTLKRAPGQKSWEELQKIPLPSQLDDVALYRNYVENDTREREGMWQANNVRAEWGTLRLNVGVEEGQWGRS